MTQHIKRSDLQHLEDWERRLIEECETAMDQEWRWCHWTAARMLGGKDGRPELLHRGIIDCLTEIDDLCRKDGGEIHSRQMVAMFIFAWQNANPGTKGYAG